jgi:hypothetical protein
MSPDSAGADHGEGGLSTSSSESDEDRAVELSSGGTAISIEGHIPLLKKEK